MTMLMKATPNETMTSKQIAVVVDSRHDHVKRSIERLSTTTFNADGSVKSPAVIVRPPMEDEQSVDSMGRNRTESVYVINERDSYIVVAQLCPEYTAKLVDYWMATKNQAPVLPINYIEALEHLLIAKKSEQQAIAERDHAIATKAQIGSKREATAMNTAAQAVREKKAIEAKLGRCINHASILAVQNATGASYAWHPLKAHCSKNGLPQVKAHDDRWGKVNTYPASAWLAVYGVDIVALFGEVAA
jgi:phage regulator Rha-like protein